VVLKRLTDAERDGDRIYAVITGIGASGGGTITPDESSYGLALERAYAEAGVSHDTVTYLEAHGPGHPGSDRMEASALASFFGTEQRPARFCAVSGIAGEIGHTGAAAGLASLVRGCLALHQEIIPPCRGAESPLPAVSGSGPLYLPHTSRYWLRNRADGPRRAGVSVFGVDGTCGHVVLEGWDKKHPEKEPERLAPMGVGKESLFVLTGETSAELSRELGLLRQDQRQGGDLAKLARQWHERTYGTHDAYGSICF
jgi:acyl transferase domain-containing protein